MEEYIYNELRKKWDEINKLKLPFLTYGGVKNEKAQYTYYKVRSGEKKENEKPEVMKHIDVFKDKFVVDIGCNAGYITYHLAQHAREWLGVERDEHFYIQALETANFIETPGSFIHSSLEYFCEELEKEYDYDAVYGANILYYLSNDALTLLQEKVLAKCDIVLMTSRENKPAKPWNDRNLGKYINIKPYLEECGFDIEIRNKNSNWVTVIGRKK
jgi:SAM-dependent methyltransferase